MKTIKRVLAILLVIALITPIFMHSSNELPTRKLRIAYSSKGYIHPDSPNDFICMGTGTIVCHVDITIDVPYNSNYPFIGN